MRFSFGFSFKSTNDIVKFNHLESLGFFHFFVGHTIQEDWGEGKRHGKEVIQTSQYFQIF